MQQLEGDEEIIGFLRREHHVTGYPPLTIMKSETCVSQLMGKLGARVGRDLLPVAQTNEFPGYTHESEGEQGQREGICPHSQGQLFSLLWYARALHTCFFWASRTCRI